MRRALLLALLLLAAAAPIAGADLPCDPVTPDCTVRDAVVRTMCAAPVLAPPGCAPG